MTVKIKIVAVTSKYFLLNNIFLLYPKYFYFILLIRNSADDINAKNFAEVEKKIESDLNNDYFVLNVKLL